MRDPYVVLGATAGDDDATIRRLYRRQSRVHHPDKGGDPERFREIADAFKQLSGNTATNEEDDGDEDPLSHEDTMTVLFWLYLLLVYVVSGLTGAFLVAGKPPLLERVRHVADVHAVLSGTSLVGSALCRWRRSSGGRRDDKQGELDWLLDSFLPASLAGSTPLQLVAAQCVGLAAGAPAVGLLWLVGQLLYFCIVHVFGRPYGAGLSCLFVPLTGVPWLCMKVGG